MSVATIVNWATNLRVALTFLSLANVAGISATFWIYAALAAALIFTWPLVPETKGHTLEEIEAHWHSRGHPRAPRPKTR